MMTKNVMIIINIQLLVIIILINQPNLIKGGRRGENQLRSYLIDENLIIKRCLLLYNCANNRTIDCSPEICIKRILHKTKLGKCPQSGPSNLIESLCQDSCMGHDYQCPNTEKCCQHSCGRTCLPAEGLENISNKILPQIPENVTVTNIHHNMAEITWLMLIKPPKIYDHKNLVSFILEGRAHIGHLFMEYKLSNWFGINYELTTTRKLYRPNDILAIEFSANIHLRPGRWYQFRIAALNENGIRGYSQPSPKFQLKDRPKNPMAPKIHIITPPTQLNNQSVYVKVGWKSPKSNYPIEKYKITWALYLKANNGSKNQSLLLNEANVQGTTYEFRDLKPNSYYYIQVQAISSFRRKRLKSPKESLLLNTTVSLSTGSIMDSTGNVKTNTVSPSPENRRLRSPPNNKFVVRFIGNKKHKMIVRVIWPEQFIGSTIELCSGNAECLKHSTLSSAVSSASSASSSNNIYKKMRSKKYHYDFIDLNFDKKYSVKLNNWNITKTFTTPTCEHFRQKHYQIVIQCPDDGNINK